MLEIAKYKEHVGSLVSFSILGFVSFIAGLVALYVAYDLLGVPYWIAVPFSVMVHLAIHYATSRGFVFTKSTRSVEEGFLIFVIIGIAEIIFITGTVTLIVEFAMGDVYWTRIGAGIVAAIGGFWANAKYTFNAL